MKAWQIVRHGEPDAALRLVDADPPTPAEGQVLVRVRATALNFPDVLMCRGTYQVRPPLPFTPGVELCGEVAAVGDGADGSAVGDGADGSAVGDGADGSAVGDGADGSAVGDGADGSAVGDGADGTGAGVTGRRLRVGDRVIGTPRPPHGSLAEYALVPAADAYPAPEPLDDAAAAGLHIAYQTGWFGLHRRARLRAGETLLVHAAAGGVGSAAVQLGKLAGARVIAVVGGADKVAVAEALGADVVVDRREQDVIAAVKQATGGRGADVIYDPVGGDAYAASAKCVAFEGRIVVIGFASGTIPAPSLSHALIKNYSIVGLHWGLYQSHDRAAIDEAHRRLTELAAGGAIAPLVGGRLPLAEAVHGLTRLAAGDTVGRLVVVP